MEENSTIGYISLMGYYKLLSSLLKYIPQLLWNRKRESTQGWSVCSVFMDLTGGIFSVLEIILELVFIYHFKLNITKLLLGSLTIIYDLLFVYQHYILYPSSKITGH
jgi:cystinosin